MRLAFIYPPYHEIKNQPSIKEVSQNYGVYPPINLAYVAAVAKNAGHDVTIIDINAEQISRRQVLSKLKQFRPDALLFTITTYLFHQTLSWIRFLKDHIEAEIIVGGVHVGLYPKETMSHKGIDYAIIGDSEKTLPNLLKTLEKDDEIKNVKHVAYRRGEKIIITGKGGQCNFLQGVYPAREYLPNEKYHEFISQRKNFTGVITTRGCPFKCTFCEQGSKNLFWKRDVDDVMDEIQLCYDKFKVKEIDFFDPIFSLDKKRTIEICDSIKELNLDMDYAIRTRVDCIDKEILHKLKMSGCKRIYYGIESSNKEILRRMNKSTNLNQIKRTIHLTNKQGINTFGYFMFGSDGETLSTMRDTMKFSLNLGLDYAQYNKTTILAGTKIYEDLKRKIGYDFWSKYTLENEEPDWIIPKLGTKLSDRQVEKEIARAYKKFYFRPSYISKRVMNLKSFDEFKRYLKAAAGFIS